MKLLGISGSLSGSKTLATVKKAIEFAVEHDSGVESEIINLSDYDIQFCDGREPSSYDGDTKVVINKIIEADAYIVGTPIYRGSLTGALKNVFDLIPNDALRGKVVGFIATGGTYHHYLAIEHQLNPLASYFRAHVVPGGVYAHNDHFENGEIRDNGIVTRLRILSESVIKLKRSIEVERTHLEQPHIPRIS
jgi:MsuE subfamily FMN reductase